MQMANSLSRWIEITFGIESSLMALRTRHHLGHFSAKIRRLTESYDLLEGDLDHIDGPEHLVLATETNEVLDGYKQLEAMASCYQYLEYYKDQIERPAKLLRLKREHLRMQRIINKILKKLARTKPVRNFPTERILLPGTIDGIDVLALPDTGADKNILSATFVRKQGIQIKKRPKFRQTLQLGDRVATQTTGQVTLPWSFANDPERVYHISFEVLEQCPTDVIIGNEFLTITKTMSVNAHRLARRKLSKLEPFHFNRAGITKQCLPGVLGGTEVYAVPDTGCDLNLMSDKYARMRGFTVDRSPKSRVFLKFPDGRIRETSGVVQVPWSFAEAPSNTEDLYFDILPGSAHDVILGSDFLFKSETFPKHTHRILTGHSAPRVLELNQIIWSKRSLFRWSKRDKPGEYHSTSRYMNTPNTVVDTGLHELLKQRAEEAEETERVLRARNGQEAPAGGHNSPSRSGLNQTSAGTTASTVAVPPRRPCGAATRVSSPHLSSATALPQ